MVKRPGERGIYEFRHESYSTYSFSLVNSFYPGCKYKPVTVSVDVRADKIQVSPHNDTSHVLSHAGLDLVSTFTQCFSMKEKKLNFGFQTSSCLTSHSGGSIGT